MILVSPAEPHVFKALGESSSLTEDYGADFLIPATASKLIAVQRKEFPGDFLNSLYDKRLAVLAQKITAADMRILVLEGQPVWTVDGSLRLGHGGFGRKFNLRQLNGLLWSLQWEYGIATYWTTGMTETAEFVTHLAEWALKPTHDSLRDRGAQPRAWANREPSLADRRSWVLQGVPGIGPTVADDFVAHFAGLPLTWTVDRKELLAAPGIGKGRLEKLTEIIPLEEEEHE